MVEGNKIPSRLKRFFWSYKFESLDLEKNKRHITKQVLSYGNMKDWEWLGSVYGKDGLKKIIRDDLYATEFRPETLKLIQVIFETKPKYESRGDRSKEEGSS